MIPITADSLLARECSHLLPAIKDLRRQLDEEISRTKAWYSFWEENGPTENEGEHVKAPNGLSRSYGAAPPFLTQSKEAFEYFVRATEPLILILYDRRSKRTATNEEFWSCLDKVVDCLFECVEDECFVEFSYQACVRLSERLSELASCLLKLMDELSISSFQGEIATHLSHLAKLVPRDAFDPMVQVHDRILNEQQQMIDDRQRMLDEKKQMLNERAQMLEKLQQMHNERTQLLEEKQHLLEERRKIVEEKQQLIDERTQLSEELQQLQNELPQMLEEQQQLRNEKQQLVDEQAQLDAEKQEHDTFMRIVQILAGKEITLSVFLDLWRFRHIEPSDVLNLGSMFLQHVNEEPSKAKNAIDNHLRLVGEACLTEGWFLDKSRKSAKHPALVRLVLRHSLIFG